MRTFSEGGGNRRTMHSRHQAICCTLAELHSMHAMVTAGVFGCHFFFKNAPPCLDLSF